MAAPPEHDPAERRGLAALAASPYDPPMTSALRIGSNLLSVVLLVAVNLLPLVGVVFWGWSLMLILVLYWVESGIVGAVNILKIARAEGSRDPAVSVDGNRITVRMSGVGAMLGRGALIGFFVMSMPSVSSFS